jgi:RNA polymerase sigma-70 factor, ECF subfamily
MRDGDWLAGEFEANRPHLRAVAYRMLGSTGEADDAVQETWLRMNRSDTSGVDNLGGWLTTVVSRVCLDMLRSRTARREEPLDTPGSDAGAGREGGIEPEQEAVLGDSIGLALLVVLETLTPAERVSFVLHDMFAVPFDDIAPIVGRSPDATRQLASRARRRVQGAGPVADADPARQRQVVDAFLAASRNGDFDALVTLLDPDVVLVADNAAVQMGSPEELRGAAAVAGMFSGRAQAARPALVDGVAGVVWAVGGRPKVVWDFTIVDGKVVHIDMLAAPERLGALDLTMVDE